MPAEVKKEIALEIAHVLFTDIVGYSKLPINEQRALVERLNEIVRSTYEFQTAEAAGRLIKIPTGDGITLVFYQSPEAPVECALEICRALKKHPELQLRMGIHSGPVSDMVDVTGKANVAGAGINMAQRVMDCGDEGTIAGFCPNKSANNRRNPRLSRNSKLVLRGYRESDHSFATISTPGYSSPASRFHANKSNFHPTLVKPSQAPRNLPISAPHAIGGRRRRQHAPVQNGSKEQEHVGTGIFSWRHQERHAGPRKITEK